MFSNLKKWPIWSWLFQDKSGVGLAQLVTVDTQGDFTDTARIAQLSAVLKVLKPLQWVAVVFIVIGLVLTIALTAVSVTHVWEVVASVKPDTTAELTLDADILHKSAFAFTVTFDIALVYLLLVGTLSSITKTSKPNTILLSILIGILNALYVFKYFPALNIFFQAFFVVGLTHVAVILLPIVFILTLLKVKSGIEYSISVFIALSTQIEVYKSVHSSALQSLGTLQNISTESGEKALITRVVNELTKDGVKTTRIAKILGGNYQNRIKEVKNILGIVEDTQEVIGE